MAKQGDREGLGKAVGRSAGKISSRLIEAVQLRLELFGFELGEEKRRLIGSLLGAIIAAILIFVGLMCLNLLLGLLFWERRVLVFGILTALYLGGGLVLALVAWIRISRGPTPFAATLEELRKDAATFRSES